MGVSRGGIPAICGFDEPPTRLTSSSILFCSSALRLSSEAARTWRKSALDPLDLALELLPQMADDLRHDVGEELVLDRIVRIYATRGPYVCIYPENTITPCKWTHEKVLSK